MPRQGGHDRARPDAPHLGHPYGFFGTGPARDAYNAAEVFSSDQTAMEQANLIASLPLEDDPGTAWDYSRSTDVLGAVVGAVSGQSLEEFMKARLFDPQHCSRSEPRKGVFC